MIKKLLLVIALMSSVALQPRNIHLVRESQRLVMLIVQDQHLTTKEGFGADHLDRMHLILDLYVGLREYREEMKAKYPHIAGHLDELERIYQILGGNV